MAEKATNNFRILPWLTFVAMLSGLAVIAAVYWNNNLTVQQITAQGLHFTEEAEILNIARKTIGINTDSLDLQDLVTDISRLDYVKSVIPYVEPNGTLRLSITEREPIALLIDGSKRMYTDEDGVKLPIIAGKNRNVPLLYGFSAEPYDTLKNAEFLQIKDFLVQARANGFGWATISEIAFDESQGVVALSHENGVKLVFGRNDFSLKLETWEAFYAQVILTKGINSMREIDLRFKNQVVTHEI